MNDIVEVLGKNVYLTLPPKEDSKLIVDENTKEALQKELILKMSRLQIWAVGEGANPKLKVGSWVCVNPEALQRAKMIPFKIEGKEVVKALILDYDIVHIWQ